MNKSFLMNMFINTRYFIAGCFFTTNFVHRKFKYKTIMTELVRKTPSEIILPADKLDYLQKELTNVREDLIDNKYIREARVVLRAGDYVAP